MLFAHSIADDRLVQDVVSRKHHIEFSVHGLSHWQRVERNGLYLARHEGGDESVISLFALFHDSQRMNDFEDPEHGKRGAALALEFHKSGSLPISQDQLDLLVHACTYHTDVIAHDDVTIQCCWDADRLDLTRVGVLPDAEFLNTASAKSVAKTMDYSEIESWWSNRA